MKRTLALLLALAILLSALPALSEAPEEKALTLMVYMCGSNLESRYGSASADIDEMLFSDVDTRRVNLLVMTGGSEAWRTEQDAGTTRISRVRRGQLSLEWESEALNMGDPSTLTALLKYGVERYPAEKYALILWDHGAGPLEGVCYDELNDPDRLSLDELAKALEVAPLPGKLSWIGFDACLMSTLEVASRLAPYAEYMIASQETEPAAGWSYDFLRDIEKDADGAATGRRIIDAYMACPLKTPSDLTLACVDLSAVGGIEASLDALYGGMAEGLTDEAFTRVSKLRFAATGFGKSVETTVASSGYDLVDVASLSACFASENPEAAAGVLQAVDRAVVAHSENLADCCGVSVYHPFRNQEQFRQTWGKKYGTLGFCPGYSDYVEAYGSIMTGEPLVRWSGLSDIQVSDDSTVTLRLTDAQAGNLASARLVVLAKNLFDEADDAYFRVFNSADVSIHDGLLTAGYDGKAMQIMDDGGITALTGAVSYSVTEDGRYLLKLYPIDADGGRWEQPIIAAYEMEASGALALKNYLVYDELTGAYSSRAEVDLSQFRGIAFLNDYRNPTANDFGEWMAFDRWDGDAHSDMQVKARNRIDRTAFAPTFALDPFRSEALYAAYEITDAQGNTYMSEMVPLNDDSVRYYASDMELGDAVPYVEAGMLASWKDRLVVLQLYLQNISDEEMGCFLPDLWVNGQPAQYAGGALNGGTGSSWNGDGAACLRPGETGTITVILNADSVDPAAVGDTLETLSGTLYMSANREDGDSYWLRFTARPRLPMPMAGPEAGNADREEAVIENLPLEMIGLGQDQFTFSCRVIGQPAADERDSRIIVNTVLHNKGEDDIAFYLWDVTLNGVPVEAPALSAMGTGGQNANGRFSVAPGETVAASILLDYRTISAILPDVSLREVAFGMAISAVEDGQNDWQNYFPVILTTEAPLDGFYDDAAALPSRELVEAGAAMGALSEASARTLFRDGDCGVDLQGVFISDGAFILLLRFENASDRPWKAALGNARLDGLKAAIGRTVNPWVQARNNRVQTRGLDKPLWQAGTGVCVELEPGEVRHRYVTVRPAEGQTKASEITLQAYMYPTDAALEGVLYGDARIATVEPGPLVEGIEAIAPAEDYTITPGLPAVPEDAPQLFLDDIHVPGGDLSSFALPIEFRPPESQRIELGYYVLFRNVRSDAELAAMNVINSPEGPDGESALSFSKGRTWLRYDASGPLTVSGDGGTATAVHPGLIPAIRAGDEYLPLIVSVVEPDGAGRFALRKYGEKVRFISNAFPNTVQSAGVEYVDLIVDPAAGLAALDGAGPFGEAALLGLRECLGEGVTFLPADADPEAIMALLKGEGGVREEMVLLLDGPTMQLSLEPLGAPEDYSVVFYYKTTDGVSRCTPALPLTDCLGQTPALGVEP